jgi:tRNA(Arg) A34 adenosine deaminase TadA
MMHRSPNGDKKSELAKDGPMDLALAQARRAADLGEVPVGAVIVGPDGQILAAAHNRTILDRDPTAHAEIVALRQAASLLGNERLLGCDLYVTLEPCAMCAGAISIARIRRLYFGADDEKGGAVEHGPRLYQQPTCHHAPDVYGGIGHSEAVSLLRDFFKGRR